MRFSGLLLLISLIGLFIVGCGREVYIQGKAKAVTQVEEPIEHVVVPECENWTAEISPTPKAVIKNQDVKLEVTASGCENYVIYQVTNAGREDEFLKSTVLTERYDTSGLKTFVIEVRALSIPDRTLVARKTISATITVLDDDPVAKFATPVLTATAKSSTQIDFKVSESSTAAASIVIELSTDGTNFVQLVYLNPGTTSFSLNQFTVGKTYHFRARVLGSNSQTSSDYSKVVAVTMTKATVKLKAPVLEGSAASTTEVTLGWSDPNTNPNERNFKIERSLDKKDWSSEPVQYTGAIRFKDKGLKPGVKYYYRVTAMATAPVVSSSPSNVIYVRLPMAK